MAKNTIGRFRGSTPLAEKPAQASVRRTDVVDDGHALFDAVVQHRLEGVVAKRRNGIYRPGYRGWTKIKNPGNWRRAMEAESIQRRRRVATTVA